MSLRATFSLKFFAHHEVFARHTVVFARLFLKRRCRPPTAVGIDTYAERVCRRRRDWVSAPKSAKSSFGVFFLIAFSFAPSSSKEKAEWTLIFLLSVEGTLALR